MSWATFAGNYSDALLAIFENRARCDGISVNRHERASYFRSHLERGILQLASIKDLPELLERSMITPDATEDSDCLN